MNTRNEILAELQEISPVLHGAKLAGQDPVVPPGYFDSLGEVVLSQIKEDPSMAVLSGLNKNQSVGVPAQYFENFANQLMEKIYQQEKEIEQGKIIPIHRSTRIIYLKRFAFAASLAGVIFLGVKLFHKTTLPVNECEDGIACLTREEIRQYVNDNIDEFEPEQIHEAFQPAIETADIENTVLPAEENNTQKIDEKQIEKYVKENPATTDLEDESTDIF